MTSADAYDNSIAVAVAAAVRPFAAAAAFCAARFPCKLALNSLHFHNSNSATSQNYFPNRILDKSTDDSNLDSMNYEIIQLCSAAVV